jgi:hypothetical protein
MGATVAQRRRSAHAAALAAKQRRQKILLGVLLVIVIAALAYEAPGIIKQIQGSSSPASAVGPPVQTTQPKAHTLPKALRGAVGDPFAVRALADGDSGVAPSFGRDPFAPPPAPSATPTGPAPSDASPLPQQIVIGKPSGKGATRGWIVILASIPTGEGRGSATSFAEVARRRGISPVSVLNSSNRRPLRGGYWVVYTGPVATLSEVENLAAQVHANGYGTAYVRELIVYH